MKRTIIRTSPLTILSLGLLLGPLGFGRSAQDGPAAVPPASGAPEFGEPLEVNGKEISDLAIQRELVYGPGQAMLNSMRIDVLIDMERDRRVAQGVDPKLLELPDAIFQQVFDAEINDFKERYPSLGVDVEVGRMYRSVDLYRRQLRQTLEFDWIFFPPGPPAEWPDLTKEAVNTGVMVGQQADAQFIDLIADAQQNWDLRKQAAEERGVQFDATAGELALHTQYALELDREDEMFTGLLRDYVIQVLGTLVTTKTASDGLPEDVVMTVQGEGVDVTLATKDLYAIIRPTITQQEIEDAKRFLALAQATEDRLAEEGFLIPQTEFDAQISSMVDEMKDSMFNFDFIALQGYQFPSLETYKRHLRLLMSYEKKIAPTLAPNPDGTPAQALIDHLKVANPVMGLSRVDAEVMLISAYDFPENRWKEGGWEWAEQESARLKVEFDAHIEAIQAHDAKRREAAGAGENVDPSVEAPKPFERYWAEMLDLHSEYWDPPMPSSGKPPSMVGYKLKGRFGAQTRNDLERFVGETPFTAFLYNDQVTDKIFADMQVGSIAGPFRGPHGYYIVYLKNRSAATNPLRLSEPRHLELLQQDYLRRQFTAYAHQCLAGAEISGLSVAGH